MKRCTIDDCGARMLAKGLCSKHYSRVSRYGTTEPRERLTSLSERFWPKVSKSEGCWEWTGSKDKRGYGRIYGGVKSPLRSHRVAYELLVGPIPEGLYLDHKCHNPSCVNPDHLRPVTQKQNMENHSGPQKNNTSSGVLGVTWFKRDNNWKAQIGHNGKNIHVGYYSTIHEAEAAVIAKRLELFTHNDADRNAA